MKPALSAAARNGKAIPCYNVTAKQFIQSYPRGAYTSARTVNAMSVFDFEHHVQRLVESSRGMHLSLKSAQCDLESYLRPRIHGTLREAMKDFQRQHKQLLADKQEYKLTILICEDGEENSQEQLQILCHIGILPSPKANGVRLRVAGRPRQSPNVKDSSWVNERQSIYDTLTEDVEEILLLNDVTLDIPEGSQTNFYVIRDGKLYTAKIGILFGTVRSLVIEQCQKAGIEIVYRAPNLKDIAHWEACFITSTSRLVLGAHVVEYPNPSSTSQTTEYDCAYFDENHALLCKIRDLVNDSIAVNCSQVFFPEDFNHPCN